MLLSLLSEHLISTGAGHEGYTEALLTLIQQRRWPEAIGITDAHIEGSSSMQADAWRLVRAALWLETVDAARVIPEMLELLPFLEGRAPLPGLGLLLAAQTALMQKDHRLAGELLHRVEIEGFQGQRRSLRVPVRVLQAQHLFNCGEVQRADHQVQRALKGARCDLEHYLAHHAAAQYRLSLLNRALHASHARQYAPGQREVQEAQHLYEQAYLALSSDQQAPPLPAVREIRLTLLRGSHVSIDGSNFNCNKVPRLVLLLTYLLLYPGRTLAQVAEDILPLEDSRAVRYTDEIHRVARLRRDLSRTRTLLMDPGLLICTQGTLSLDPAQRWSSDLQEAMLAGDLPRALTFLPLHLDCEWLDQLRCGATLTNAG